MSKISELSDGGSLLPTDFLIAVRSGGNVKVQADQTEFDRIRLGDNEKIELGNNQDLQIYHDGSNSWIHDGGTGNLNIEGRNIFIVGANTDTNLAGFIDGAEARLYHNGSQKLATTSTGIDVTGTVTADTSLNIEGTYQAPLARFNSTSGFARIALQENGTARMYMQSLNGSDGVKFMDGDGTTQRMRIADNGDVSLYEDTGTTAKLFWDASAESLGIGTTSPTTGYGGTSALDASGPILARGAIAAHQTNAGVFQYNSNETAIRSYGATSGSGQITFSTGGGGAADAERMRIDSSGNVGIGVVPNTGWNSTYPSLQIGLAGALWSEAAGATTLVSNNEIYHTNGSYYRLTAGAANDILLTSDGTFKFRSTATSAAAGTLIYDQTTKMTIDASGNVGIGNTIFTSARVNAPHLVVGSGSNSPGLTLYGAANSQGSINFADSTTGTDSYDGGIVYGFGSGSPYLSFHVNSAAERMRIDASGNWMLGTTDSSLYTSSTENGLFITSSGQLRNSTNAVSAYFNRTGSDGTIVQFNKDGTTVGSINAKDGDITIGTGDVGFRFYDDGDAIYPAQGSTGAGRDAAIDLGRPNQRWKDIYASGGIYLGGTAAANLLSDFETGTFTPTVSDDATGVLESATIGGYYTKVGNQVTLYFNFRVTTNFTGSFVGGLPFQVDHASMTSSWISGGVVLGGASNTVSAGLQNGTSVMRLFNNNHLGDTHEPNTTMDYYRFQLSYRTDS